MKPFIKICLIGSALLACLAALWFVEPLTLMFSGLMLLLYIGGPLLLFGFISLIYDLRKGTYGAGLKVICFVAGFALLFGLGILANHFVYKQAEAAALAYPAQVAPLLEAYREIHGSYPARLDDLPVKPSTPRLLRRDSRYASWQGGYSFSFAVPGGILESWTYDSSAGEWHLED